MPALFGAMAKRYGWPSVKAITCEVIAFRPTSADSDLMKSRPSGPHVGETPLGPVVDEQTPVRVAAQRLRNTLRINALTSTLGGLVCVLAGGWTSTTLGTRHAGLVRLVGLGLVVFAVGVAAVAGSRVSKLSRWAPVVSTADAVWVVATVATVGAGWYSAIGVAVVGGVALIVGGFGLAQFRAWRHLRSVVATRPMSMFDEVPPVEVAHVERTVRGGREVAWAVVTDHELYGRLAPNLSGVHVQSGTGAGMVRVCSNNGGEEWSETCTVWDEGQRFEVNVRTERYPYPLAVMRGSWWVHPETPGTSLVGMDFRYQPQPGIKGRVFAALMQAGFPLVLHRILRGWQHEIKHSNTQPQSTIRRGRTRNHFRHRTRSG